MTNLLVKLFVRNHTETENAAVRTAYGTLAAVVGVVLNFLLAGLKIFVGVFASSLSVVADAVNNLSDAGSSVISFISFKISAKPADRDHPHGHARIEYVTSMIVGMIVVLVGFELLLSAGRGLVAPTKAATVQPLTLVLLGVAILAKLWLGLFNFKIGKRIDSSVMRATAVDSLSDSLSTFAVLVGAALTYVFPDAAFTPYIDGAMGLLVSVLILIAGLRILNEAKNRILGEAPTAEEIRAVTDIVRSYPDIIGIHDVVFHHYGPGNAVVSLHAEVDGTRNMFDVHDVIDNIEMRVLAETGAVCTIHTDPIATDADTAKLLLDTQTTLHALDPAFGLHDFRVVRGKTHSNLLFDVTVPFEYKASDVEVKRKVVEAIHEADPHFYAVVHVDRV